MRWVVAGSGQRGRESGTEMEMERRPGRMARGRQRAMATGRRRLPAGKARKKRRAQRRLDGRWRGMAKKRMAKRRMRLLMGKALRRGKG
jgi:hypothetical protein